MPNPTKNAELDAIATQIRSIGTGATVIRKLDAVTARRLDTLLEQYIGYPTHERVIPSSWCGDEQIVKSQRRAITRRLRKLNA